MDLNWKYLHFRHKKKKVPLPSEYQAYNLTTLTKNKIQQEEKFNGLNFLVVQGRSWPRCSSQVPGSYPMAC